MHMKKAVLALLAGGLLLPAAGFAQNRLNGSFRTLDSTAGADNEACTVASGGFFGVGGDAHAVNGNCDIDIFYFTNLPNSAGASSITGNKSTGTAKVSQSIFTTVVITVDDTGGSCASGTYEGEADSEKCKASGSLKGTPPDTANSDKVSLSCDLGDAGANLSPVPSTNTLSTITTAFASRKDVKIDSKGKLSIKHNGTTSTTSGFCGF